MVVENFFDDVITAKEEMQKALKEFVEAKEDFYNITGTNYSAMPKGKAKIKGFDDLMAIIETLYENYLEKRKNYNEERNKCLIEIKKLEKPIYRLIIEYTYIDEKRGKALAEVLSEYHNFSYSFSYLKVLKAKAEENFKKIILNSTK